MIEEGKDGTLAIRIRIRTEGSMTKATVQTESGVDLLMCTTTGAAYLTSDKVRAAFAELAQVIVEEVIATAAGFQPTGRAALEPDGPFDFKAN